jgi:alkaline phosphatase
MIINSQNIARAIVEIVVKEQELIADIQKISDRHETALNLKNIDEINAIEKNGKEIQERCNNHFGQKLMIMVFATTLNNFREN